MVSTVSFFLPGTAHFQPVNKHHTQSLKYYTIAKILITSMSVNYLSDVIIYHDHRLPQISPINIKGTVCFWGLFFKKFPSPLNTQTDILFRETFPMTTS